MANSQTISKKGSFWWKDILKLLDKFKGMASVPVADGSSCLLWDDCWQGQPLKLTFPEIYSFVKKPDISLKAAVAVTAASSLFNLPLTVEAFDQFQQIEHLLQNLQMVNGADTWTYIWGTSIFSYKRAYRHLLGSSWSHPIFKWIWKSSCQHTHKVFSSCSLKTDLARVIF